MTKSLTQEAQPSLVSNCHWEMVALFRLQKIPIIFHYDRRIEKIFLKAVQSIVLTQYPFHTNIYIPEQFLENQI